MNTPETFIENRTFNEISVGDSVQLSRKLGPKDIALLTEMSRKANPAHFDDTLSQSDAFKGLAARAIWGGALISTVLATELPGPGTTYLDQNLQFRAPILAGDTILVSLVAADKNATLGSITFDCKCVNQDGVIVIDGTATVLAPTEKLRRPRNAQAPTLPAARGEKFRKMIAQAKTLEPIITAVVHPTDANALGGAVAGANARLIIPVLVGPEAKIKAAARDAGLDISPYRLVATEHSNAAAEKAAAMAHTGEVQALMKGSLHSDEFLHPVFKAENNLRTERRITHVFLFDVPNYDRLLFITDGAINITPDLDTKRDIVQNAIDMAHALGNRLPKVAILSAVEMVNSQIPSTIDAAALCKMADRGQITGGFLDGPLGFDNAVSVEAAKTKGIISPVAGQADILVVPDLDAGNMLAKQLEYLAGADSAGIVLGARVPIILTSRADNVQSRLASCAAAALTRHYNRLDKIDIAN